MIDDSFEDNDDISKKFATTCRTLAKMKDLDSRGELLELRYCHQDHKVKGGLEWASLKADLIRKAQYILPRSLSTRYLRHHLSIECEIQFTAKGFLVLLSCGPETITKV